MTSDEQILHNIQNCTNHWCWHFFNVTEPIYSPRFFLFSVSHFKRSGRERTIILLDEIAGLAQTSIVLIF